VRPLARIIWLVTLFFVLAFMLENTIFWLVYLTAAAVLLFLKLLALLGGVRWLLLYGESFAESLNAKGNWNDRQRRKTVYREFRANSMWYAPFGVFDWKWRKAIDDLDEQPSPVWSSIRSYFTYRQRGRFYFPTNRKFYL